jgi:mediator of RNA polymerase II transcription subunit 6
VLPLNANRSKTSESHLAHASKENTPIPDSLSSAKKTSPSSVNTSTYLSSRLLAESLDMTLRYGEEYMDENPITGHPGDFHLSTTGRKGRPGDALKVPPVTTKGLSQQSQAKTNTAPPTPEAAKAADIVPPVRKGSRGDKSPKTPGMPKPKRRKSKALSSAGGISPT